MPPTVSHWTNKGTFRMEPRILAASLWCALYFGERELAVFEKPWTAAQRLFAGDFDAELGFSPSSMGVPEDWEQWNGLR